MQLNLATQADLKQELATRADVDRAMAEARAAMDRQFAQLGTAIDNFGHRLFWRVATLMVAAIIATFGIVYNS